MSRFLNPLPEKGNLIGNWTDLLSLTEDVLRHETPSGLAVKHTDLLESLKKDTFDDKGVLLGFYRAPAAKGNHHAFEGGLVYHLLEMWRCYLAISDHWGNEIPFEDHITDSLVLRAILYHDIHKAYRTFRLLSKDPFACEYCNDPTDQLMGPDVKSLWLINSASIHPSPEQINALLNAEGGFSKIKTNWQSSLSKLCYVLDELSGNVLGRIRTRTVLNLRKPEPPK